MDSGKITLLTQLVSGLKDNFVIFEKSYKESDKENFDRSKKIILELQHKIDFLLR
jgi:hypothetical protein